MKIITLVLGVLTIISLFSCSISGPDNCPSVDLKLLSVDSRNAEIVWSNAGSNYCYSLYCSYEETRLWYSGEDTMTTIEEIHYIEGMPEKTTDTVFLIKGLSPDTKYHFGVEISHISDAEMPNSSAFYFRTLKEE